MQKNENCQNEYVTKGDLDATREALEIAI